MKKIFQTSRWGGKSFWFPEKLILDDNSLTYQKKTLFSSKEVTIPYDKIASIKVEKGIAFADIFIETSGGERIIIKGFNKSDAEKINDIVNSKINSI